MFVVYKITNLINNKSYIGSSTQYQKRWRQHINTSKNPNGPQYKYPLYEDIRNFNIENFVFEILANDFGSVYEMEEYEQKMIDYYNTLVPNGYNQTRATHSNNIQSENYQKHILKTSQKCAKIDKNNNIIEIYSSYHDAARKNGRDGDIYASAVRQVCKGQTSSCFNGLYFRDLDNDGNIIYKEIKNQKGRKKIIGINVITLEEKYFNSVSQAADELKTDRGSIQQCIQGSTRYSIVKNYILREVDIHDNIIYNNIDINERIEEFQKRNPIINNEQHDIQTWCEIYGISPTTVNARIRRGWDSITAITTPVKGR